DLLTTIGIERATIVGHSLGGGVAMQFFYQFPQRVERLGLVSSGGPGAGGGPRVRGAADPGAPAVARPVAHPARRGAGRPAGRAAGGCGGGGGGGACAGGGARGGCARWGMPRRGALSCSPCGG